MILTDVIMTRTIDIICWNLPMNPSVFVRRSIVKLIEAIVKIAVVAQKSPVGWPVVVYSSTSSGRSFFTVITMNPQRTNSAKLRKVSRTAFLSDCFRLSSSSMSVLCVSILNVSRLLFTV